MSDNNFIVYYVGSFVRVTAYKFEGHAKNYVKKMNDRELARLPDYKKQTFTPVYAYMSAADYKKETSKTVTKKNFMTGEPIEVAVGTPASCDPSTETYWSI
jgi:hypothetical protein